MVSFRPTTTQALGRGAFLGGVVGLAVCAVMALLWVAGGIDPAGLPIWVGLLVPLAAAVSGGAAAGIVLGRAEGADIDDSGIHPTPGTVEVGYAPWQRIVDLRAERRGGRTRIAIHLDTGHIARLPAPYDGRWLGSDPEFERKLFMLRNLWECNRY